MPPAGDHGALWDRVAPTYDWAMVPLERYWLTRLRSELIAKAVGNTVEVGIGTGVNLAWYPEQVQLVGVDSSPKMLQASARHAARLGRQIELQPGRADDLGLATHSVDTVVATLLMCSVPDVEATLAEFARVLVPGGRLLLLDHVESSVGALRLVQRLCDHLTVKTGERWRRRPLTQLAQAGFDLSQTTSTKARIFEVVAAQRA